MRQPSRLKLDELIHFGTRLNRVGALSPQVSASAVVSPLQSSGLEDGRSDTSDAAVRGCDASVVGYIKLTRRILDAIRSGRNNCVGTRTAIGAATLDANASSHGLRPRRPTRDYDPLETCESCFELF